MKRIMALLLLACAWAWADLSVQNIKVQQRWPWNGLVDIDYEVVCDDKDADIYVFFSGTDKDLNKKVAMLTMTGEGANNQPVKAGKRRATWNMTADAPSLHTTAFSLHIELCQGSGLYLVIDLSGGATATSYPYEYSIVGPDLTNDSCRKDKLWLRFIPPNSSAVSWLNVDYGYYMGIFEMTQKQYELVMGSNPSYKSYLGDTYPVNYVYYSDIRGSGEGAGYPSHNRVDAGSFMGKLRAKTGLNCDLPTETQWEYACRAGTTDSTCNVAGKTQNDVAWHSGNAETYRVVGKKLPNAWGCYDMLGNVWEWCRDWYTENKYRSVRGGSWHNDSSYSTTTSRNSHDPYRSNYYSDYSIGFRLAVLPADK